MANFRFQIWLFYGVSFVAWAGHVVVHSPHPWQFSFMTMLLLFSSFLAWNMQRSRHVPQPLHFSKSTFATRPDFAM